MIGLSRTTVALGLALGVMVIPAAVRASDTKPHPVLLTFDPSFCLNYNGRFLHATVNDPRFLAYLGATVQVDLPARLAANLFGGLGGCLSESAGATIRYRTEWSPDHRLTAGLGPMIASTLDSDTTALAEGDVALEIRFRSGFALALGPRLMVALNSTGGERCSNCVFLVPAGTYWVTFRIGVGFNL